MQRRGFLQSLLAAAAGLSAVGTASAMLAPQEPMRPQVVEKPKKKRRKKKPTSSLARSPQDEAMELLKQCRVIAIEEMHSVAGALAFTVRYAYAGNEWTRTELDDKADSLLAGAKPRSITVECTAQALDIDAYDLHLGAIQSYSVPSYKNYEVVVEWVAPHLKV